MGDYGNGTLNVEAGGLVSNKLGFIGYNFGSTGVPTITAMNVTLAGITYFVEMFIPISLD